MHNRISLLQVTCNKRSAYAHRIELGSGIVVLFLMRPQDTTCGCSTRKMADFAGVTVIADVKH